MRLPMICLCLFIYATPVHSNDYGDDDIGLALRLTDLLPSNLVKTIVKMAIRSNTVESNERNNDEVLLENQRQELKRAEGLSEAERQKQIELKMAEAIRQAQEAARAEEARIKANEQQARDDLRARISDRDTRNSAGRTLEQQRAWEKDQFGSKW